MAVTIYNGSILYVHVITSYSLICSTSIAALRFLIFSLSVLKFTKYESVIFCWLRNERSGKYFLTHHWGLFNKWVVQVLQAHFVFVLDRDTHIMSAFLLA